MSETETIKEDKALNGFVFGASFTGILLVTSLFIYFTPFLMGKKQPTIEADIIHNVNFFNQVVEKYIDRHRQPPESIAVLFKDAKSSRYNKTFYNPSTLHAGDMTDIQIVAQYPQELYKSFSQDYQSKLYTGKVGYYSDGQNYYLRGHAVDGSFLPSLYEKEAMVAQLESLNKMFQSYIQRHKKLPPDMALLQKDAKAYRYNQGFENLVNRVKGEVNNTQIVHAYPSELRSALQTPDTFKSRMYAGRMGYVYQGLARYTLYAHDEEGRIIHSIAFNQ